jgi:hypothetical protein
MNFMAWLSSLDELLYEVMSWILFLPITLWRIIRDPLGMMNYADTELARPDEKDQYQDTLSPPLFLVLCILLTHALSLSMGQRDALVASNHGLSGLVSDETTALLVRTVLFGAFPLFMAARLVRRQRQTLVRRTLEPHFYAHCYPVGAMALAVGIGGALVGVHRERWELTGLLCLFAGLVAYGVVSALWFARRLNQPLWRSFIDASIGMTGGIAATAVMLFLFRP